MEFSGALRYLNLVCHSQRSTDTARRHLRALQTFHGLASNLSFTKVACEELWRLLRAKETSISIQMPCVTTNSVQRLGCGLRAVTLVKHCVIKLRAVWVKEMFGDIINSSPTEEYDEQDERGEQDSLDFLDSWKLKFDSVFDVDAGSKSSLEKVVGSSKHARETTFDVFTEGTTRR